MYRERPARRLPATAWRAGADQPAEHRVLPDGCMDVIWADGTLLIAGPDTTATLATWPAGSRFAGLRFDAGRGPALLAVPADEVRDRRVPLAEVWGDGPARRLAEQVAEAADPVTALENALAARPVDSALVDDRLVPAVLAGVRRRASVAEVGEAAGIGERQLLRRCRAVFGYGPKTLARILRLQDALALARGGTALAHAAAEAGYADQPHLARDVRALAGVPLRTLLRQQQS
ncbi:helix-turn-helix domain-containing protein [Parafrankia sp. FMc2]|uniref:helix-turn-helix domain-containing protein n=1 Tax=Parafrankia sp. FMc2 TaxID=3233196 RepID=UPI0034D48B60